tara:strand:+ start:1162 stop:2238 length:1077 start_codon:yes stop_codon:yes gene_type:complete
MTLLLPTASHAYWVKATGEAEIIDDDISQARHQAIHDAQRNALAQGGIYLTSEQQLSKGVVTKDAIKTVIQGKINDTRITSEKQSAKQYKVVIEAHIAAADGMCPANRAPKKNIVMTDLLYQGRLSSANAKLLTWLPALSEKWSQHMAQSDYFYPHYNTREGAILGNQAFSPLPPSLPPSAMITDYQYLVAGRIVKQFDKKIAPQSQSLFSRLKKPFRKKVPHVQIEWAVYDSLSRQRIAVEQVAIPVTDDNERLQQPLNKMLADLERTLGCQATMARISDIDKTSIRFPLGAMHNVNQGSSFHYLISRQGFDHNNQPYTRLTPGKVMVDVKEVYPSYSIGTLSHPIAIQPGDVISSD